MPLIHAQEVPRWRPLIFTDLKILLEFNVQEILCLAALVPPTTWYVIKAVTVRRNKTDRIARVEYEEQTLVRRGRTQIREVSRQQDLSL